MKRMNNIQHHQQQQQQKKKKGIICFETFFFVYVYNYKLDISKEHGTHF